MKRREALTLATTWTDPENRMLRERSRHRRTQGVIPLMGDRSRTGRSTDRVDEWLPKEGE